MTAPAQPDDPPPEPWRITPDSETAKVMAIHLRKTAELAARLEMERLIEEAKRQEGEPPQRNL